MQRIGPGKSLRVMVETRNHGALISREQREIPVTPEVMQEFASCASVIRQRGGLRIEMTPIAQQS